MPAASGLLRAGALLALGSFVALACSSDTIDLLPPQADQAGAGGSGSAGKPGQAGANASAGTGNKAGHDSGSAGAGGSGGCWNATCGGSGNNNGGVANFAGFGFGGFAGLGSDICLTNNQAECRLGYRCDVILGRCAPACDGNNDCDQGRVCDPQQGTCVPCVHDFDCEFDDDLETHFCALRHCVECLQDEDCDKAGHPDRHCDVPRGRCE